MSTTKKPGDDDEKTVRLTPTDETKRASTKLGSDYDEPTVRLNAATSRAPARQDEERTVLVRGGSAKVGSASADEPVTGWLVVLDGPGRGAAVSIGYGQNAIGRGSDQRVSLDFGDEQISREEHALLTYDPRGRKFYVQHGGGKNLTYLGDQPVLMPQEITTGATLLIGQTTLRFVALCGPDFDWGDKPGAD